MFQKNEVVSYKGAKYRILEVRVDQIIWILLDKKRGMPEWFDRHTLTESISEDWFQREKDPYADLLMSNPAKGSRAQQLRDTAFEVIQPIVDDPDVFRSDKRSKRIKEVMVKTEKTWATIYKYLKKYWKRGQHINALLPDFQNCGVSAEDRTAKTKVGRPRSIQPGLGCVVTDHVQVLMEKIIKDHLLIDEPKTLPKANIELGKLYLKYYPNTPEAELPTVRQLRYYFHKKYSKAKRLEAQTPKRVYNKDTRPLESTVNTHVLGPGSRYEIDATIADVYLVSSVDRSRIVGRPTVYVVVDTFSRLIAGLYVGLENPSYAAAILALANAFLKKAEYCAEFGINIADEEWPAHGLPAVISADKAELLGSQIEYLSEKFRVRIENPAAYRADAKGVVERRFRTLQADFKPYVPGVVTETRVKKRGGKDYRLDATLTIEEFTKIIIESILHHNNDCIIEGYDRSSDMPPELETKAIALWNWGLSNRTGQLRTASSEAVLVALLPREKVTVSPDGVKLWGLTYTGNELLKSSWLHRSKGVYRPQNLLAAYDPADTNRIFLLPDAETDEYWVCNLTDRSRFYANMTFKEAKSLMQITKQASAAAELNQQAGQRKLTEKIESIIADATSKKPSQSSKSNAERTRDIRQNKADELANERANRRVSGRDKDVSDGPATKADVVPLTDQDDYTFPDMTDELFGDDD